MFGEKGQVGLEYLIVTVFVLTAVVVIFVFAFLNYEQNIKIASANDAITSLMKITNEVYLRGEGNTRFVDVSFPNGLQSIGIVNLCSDGTMVTCATGTGTGCSCPTGSTLMYSAIRLTVGLTSGSTEIMRISRTKIELDNFPAAAEAAGGPSYTIKAEWDSSTGKVKLTNVT